MAEPAACAFAAGLAPAAGLASAACAPAAPAAVGCVHWCTAVSGQLTLWVRVSAGGGACLVCPGSGEAFQLQPRFRATPALLRNAWCACNLHALALALIAGCSRSLSKTGGLTGQVCLHRTRLACCRNPYVYIRTHTCNMQAQPMSFVYLHIHTKVTTLCVCVYTHTHGACGLVCTSKPGLGSHMSTS